jgi:X-X-X-Leu-X-X-Gly heptad repeat protein
MGWRGEAVGTRAPNQALGYDRNTLHLGGMGSGMGQANSGTSQLGTGIGGVTVAGQSWHPTIIYLFALILAEMIVFGFVSRLLK